MNNDIILDAQHVSRTYGSGSQAYTAVRDASLQIRRGELFAILGTNGVGKTSLMEVLEGLSPATKGTVRVWGKGPPQAARRRPSAHCDPHRGPEPVRSVR